MSAMTQKRKDQISKEVLKLRREPENLKCVDCSNRNCSYVCTNFSTFLCSDCAGLYRKYCFRVKSCTVATFTEKEYENLKTSGGNEECNRKYMARWKKRADGPIPKQGDLKALDEFINKKYVKKMWFKEKKKKKKTRKVNREEEKRNSKSKSKSKVSSASSTGKRPQENQQLESGFFASETVEQNADEEWDPWGSNLHTKTVPSTDIPKADLLSDFSFGAMPAVGADKNEDNWDPFSSKPSAAAPRELSSARKPSLDIMAELISNIKLNKQQDESSMGSFEAKKSPIATTPEQQKRKPLVNDPFFTMVNNAPACEPMAKTSPISQVRAATQLTQQPPPIGYPMYMNTYTQPYGMAQPAPYSAQYNMARQQPMNPFGAQMATNPRHVVSQNMQFGAHAPAQMNNYGYQLPSFDVTPASQVSQDNPFS